MISEPIHETIQKALTGALMVLTVSQLLIRSAALTGPVLIPWLWAVGFGLAVLLPAALPRRVKRRSVQWAGTVMVILAVGGALIPLMLQSVEGPGIRIEAVRQALGQLTAYLAGASPSLPDTLQGLGLHGLCAACSLVLLWVRAWGHRSVLLGTALFFGILRWHQYVPDMEAPVRNLILVWIFSAAVTAPRASAGTPANPAGMSGRSFIALLLTAGVLAGSAALTALFPLDELNHWIGARLPVQDRFRNEYAQHASAGFALSDTLWHPLGNRLGGPVTLEKRPIMEVRSSRPGLYLRGAVRTVYTGQAWETPAMTQAPKDPAPSAGGTEPFVLTIHPFGAGDLTAYAPLNTDRILSEHRRVRAGGEGLYRFGFQWFPAVQQDYRVEGYLSVPAPAFAPSLAPYLQLPVLSGELQAVTASITSSQDTDAGRMERLVAWLRAEGTYRLNVPAPDPEKDFVEQFVLGSRQGYCTYYATALAVMGRMAGVPTRYVEGYHLPEAFAGRQTYLITSDRAHAWVEAYISGKGWVTYEPTPGFGAAGEGGGASTPAQADAPLGIETESNRMAPMETPDRYYGGLRELAGALLLTTVLLIGFRIVWVERSWQRGEVGPRGALWQLYGILSALMLLAPDLKGMATPVEQLRAANAIFPFRGFASHDIIGEANRLLYGNTAAPPAGFSELLTELWQACRARQGTAGYLYARYVSLALFNSYTPLISHRQFRKDVHHGADQPHTSPQS